MFRIAPADCGGNSACRAQTVAVIRAHVGQPHETANEAGLIWKSSLSISRHPANTYPAKIDDSLPRMGSESDRHTFRGSFSKHTGSVRSRSRNAISEQGQQHVPSREGLSQNTQRQIEVQDTKAHCQDEKRKLTAFAVGCFAQYIDLRRELTDSVFENVLRMASADVKRYQRQDAGLRRLLGISRTDSCEDAVADLLLESNRRKL